MIIEEFGFTSDGVEVAGRLTRPDDNGEPVPAVVTAPGFAGVKEMLIPTYATGFATRGVAHLAFDYPGFGGSGGSPRQQVDPPQQLRTFHAALAAVSVHPGVDPTRLGVWGTSLSGGHAIALAGQAPQIRAVAAVIPFIKLKPTLDLRLFRATAIDGIAAAFRRPRRRIAVAGRPGQPAVMTSDGAFEWAADMTKDAPVYENAVTVASLGKMLRWTIRDKVPTRDVPLFVILAEKDSITPPGLVRDTLRGAHNVEWTSFPETHFELFTDHGAEVCDLVVTWLSEQLIAC